MKLDTIHLIHLGSSQLEVLKVEYLISHQIIIGSHNFLNQLDFLLQVLLFVLMVGDLLTSTEKLVLIKPVQDLF